MGSRDIAEICSGLRAPQQTRRKEAWKNLALALNGGTVTEFLDKHSATVKLSEKLPVDCWPGLCLFLLKTIYKEFEQKYKQKVLEGSAKTTRLCFKLAQDVARHGRPEMLSRAAAGAFSSILKILQNSGLASPLGDELGAVLRLHLLPNSVCTEAGKAEVFQGLLNIYMNTVEKQSCAKTEELNAMSTLHLLLLHFPGQLQQEFQRAVLDFLVQHSQKVGVNQTDHRLPLAFLSCVNAFLLRSGLDAFGMAASLHAGLRGFLVSVGKQHDRLADGVASYLRIQLKLGGIADSPQSLCEAQEWAWAQIGSLEQALSSTGSTPKRLEAVVEVCAAAFFQQMTQAQPGSRHADEASEGSQGPPSKRRRVGDVPSIWPGKSTVPAGWAVLSALLYSYGFRLEQEQLEGWLAAAEEALKEYTAQQQAATHAALPKAGCSQDMWAVGVLGFLAQLARAWLLRALVRVSTRCKEAPVPANWQSVAAASVQLLQSGRLSGQASAECCSLLTSLSELGLAAWVLQRLPLMGLVAPGKGLARLELLLVTSALRPVDGKAAPPGTVTTTLSASILASCIDHPREAGDALLAALGASPVASTALVASDRRWWQAAPGDVQFLTSLEALTRGKDYVAEEALQLALSHTQQRASISLRSTHHQAAAALEERLEAAAERAPGGDMPHLKELISLTTVCAQIMAELHRSSQEVRHCGQCAELGSAWATGSTLAGALTKALRRLASVVAGLMSGGEAGFGDAYQQLEILLNLLAQLHAYAQAPEFARCLRGLPEELLREVAGVSNDRSRDAEDVPQMTDVYDHDLDRGTLAAPSGRVSSSATGLSSARSRAMACARVLGSCGALGKAASTAGSTLQVYDRLESEEAPQELLVALVEAIGEMVAASGDATQLKHLLTRLYTPRFALSCSNANLRVVFSQIKRHAGWIHEKHAADEMLPEDVREALGGMKTLLSTAKNALDMEDGRNREGVLTSSAELRGAFCQAGAVLMKIDCLSDEELGELKAAILACLCDPCYIARRAAVQPCTLLLDVFENPKTTLDDILANIRIVEIRGATSADTAAALETSLLTLGAVGAHCPAVEQEAVAICCIQAALHPPSRGMACAVLEHAGARMGYPRLSAYMAYHFLPLVYNWMLHSHLDLPTLLSIQDIVTTVPAAADEAAFLKAHCSSLVPCLLFKHARAAQGLQYHSVSQKPQEEHRLRAIIRQATEELDRISDSLGVSTQKLMEDSFPATLGLAYPSRYVDADGKRFTKAVVEDVMGHYLTASMRDALLAKTCVATIATILEAAGTGTAVERPFYSVPLVLRAIIELPGKHDETENRQVLQGQILDGDKFQQLLNRVHHGITAARCDHHVLAKLGSLQAFMHLAADRTCDAPLFRYLVHILLRCLAFRKVQAPVCEMFGELLERVLGEQKASVLGPLLQPILFGLTESVEAETARIGEEAIVAGHPIVSLILRLTVQAPDHLHPYLVQVEPLPGNQVFDEARSLHERLRQAVSLGADLSNFAERCRSMPFGLRQHSLGLLRARLEKEKASLLMGRGGEDDESRDIMKAATWNLVQENRELADPEIADFVGQLLAIQGPLPPAAIAFSLPKGSGGASRRLQSAAEAAKGWAGAAFECMLTQALEQLAAFLVDENAATVASAQSTLRQLLSTEKGAALLRTMDTVTMSYLAVFARGAAGPASSFAAERGDPGWNLANKELWDVDKQGYQAWVCRVAFALLIRSHSQVLGFCGGLVRHEPAFAELLLPHIFLEVAAYDAKRGALGPVISRQLSRCVFRQPPPEPRVIGMMLKVLNHLRCFHLDGLREDPSGKRRTHGSGASLFTDSFPKTQVSSLWPKVYWLDVPYLEVAASALQAEAGMTALLYVEEWFKEEYGALTIGTGPDILWKEGLPASEQLLLDIYSGIQEPDSVYAVARSHHPASLLRLLEHEGQWDQALVMHTLAARAGGATQHHRGVVGALDQGWPHGIPCYLAGLQGSAEGQFEEERCEAAWRLGQWESLPADQHGGAEQPGEFHAAICGCLKALENPDKEDCSSLLRGARQGLVASISSASREAASGVNSVLVQLQMLELLAEAQQLKGGDPAGGADVLVTMQDRWRSRELAAGQGGKFQLVEPLQALQKAVLGATGNVGSIPAVLFRSAMAARKAGNLQKATMALHELRCAANAQREGNKAGELRWHIEEAKLLWTLGQQGMALRLAQGLLATSARWQKDRLHICQLMTLLGKWQTVRRSVSSTDVLQGMAGAFKQLDQRQDPSNPEWRKQACRSAFRLAQYSDALYVSAEAHMDGPEWASKEAVMAHKRRQVGLLEKQAASVRSEGERRCFRRNIHQLQTLIQADEAELRSLESAKEAYFWTAVDGYIKCLQCGSLYDMPACFRLVQLWLQLGSLEAMNIRMHTALETVPSYKFLPLVYQMASRMSASQTDLLAQSGFQEVLSKLMVRLGTDHPHHTIYQVLALKNGNRTRAGKVSFSNNSSQGGLEQTVDTHKVTAATEVIEAIATGPRGRLVAQMERLAEAYIELAAVSVRKDEDSMPLSTSWVRKLKALGRPPIVSKSVAVDPSCRYEDLPGLANFEDTISFVGGINKPKLIVCIDERGVRHRQLVKSGNDDLRQDAVMQQFFSLVNHLLQNAETTRQRQLSIRTYKVVPCSPFAGLLEWVEETMPLANYLLGSNRSAGAHVRLHRSDWKFMDCMDKMCRAAPEQKLRVYQQVCRHFKPCLHYFFLERFPDPAAWFERRLSYTRSTAVSSMAGYLIGLGDRHSANLLIDTSNAEIVHIDLGIAFEQGKFLSTPERVPFRLTRDIVDGMGATGVEGVMRHCCEEALRVLRKNKELLLTIIEVFIHDPLYKWALTAKGAEQRQRDDMINSSAHAARDELPDSSSIVRATPVSTGASLLADGAPSTTSKRLPRRRNEQAATQSQLDTSTTAGLVINADAERALLRVRHKLEGLEEGEGDARSVEGQVERLLQEAQDPEKLCQMYPGWAPWV